MKGVRYVRRIRNAKGLTETEFLSQYDPGRYERPSVTADVLLFSLDPQLNHLKLLLIKRENHPFIDCFALPGGFVEINESAYEAAKRELLEETGLTDIYLEQLYTYSNPERDPRMRVITVAYMGLIPYTEVQAGDDASDAKWFDVSMDQRFLTLTNEELGITIQYSLKTEYFRCGRITYENTVAEELISEDSLAFDHHLAVLDGLKRLRNKLEYTDLAFNLVDELFTLPDLQRIYELILGKKLYKKNFNDKISEKLQATDTKIKSICGEKLATAYQYKGRTKQ